MVSPGMAERVCCNVVAVLIRYTTYRCFKMHCYYLYFFRHLINRYKGQPGDKRHFDAMELRLELRNLRQQRQRAKLERARK